MVSSFSPLLMLDIPPFTTNGYGVSIFLLPTAFRINATNLLPASK
uniref:Uncharacterized protein n=1 Tax=Manihot esculenta TaxID=3983 RepID=A0A2C9W344_MANES